MLPIMPRYLDSSAENRDRLMETPLSRKRAPRRLGASQTEDGTGHKTQGIRKNKWFLPNKEFDSCFSTCGQSRWELGLSRLSLATCDRSTVIVAKVASCRTQVNINPIDLNLSTLTFRP